MVIDKVYTATKDGQEHVALGLDDNTVLALEGKVLDDLREALTQPQSISLPSWIAITISGPGSRLMEGRGSATILQGYDALSTKLDVDLEYCTLESY